MPRPGSTGRFGPSRVAGIDIARGLAVLGMFSAHALPRADDAELLVDGRSSILFAILAGISLGIMTGGQRPSEPGGRADRVLGIVWRSIVLLMLGLLLSTAPSGVLVILDYYGIMFLLMVPLLFFPRWVLALLALILAVAAPAMAEAAEESTGLTLPLPDVLDGYLLTGSYPALVWLPFLLAGLIAARSDLGRLATQGWMTGGGALAAVAGYGAASVLPGVTAEAHSGSTAEIVGTGGFAVAIVGVLLFLTSPERTGFGEVVRLVLWPIGAIGSMALTVYTLQILALAVFVQLKDDGGEVIQYPGWPLLIGMTISCLLFACCWRWFLGKGPLERMLGLVNRRHPPGERGAHNHSPA
jgi:uncharacterized membrane protein YeiB